MKSGERKLVYWNLIIAISTTLLLIIFSFTSIFKEVELKRVVTGMAVSVADAGDEGYTISELKQKFDDSLNYYYNDYYAKFTPGKISDRNSSYFLEPFIAGFVSIYEATQNDKYIEDALNNVENVLSKMVDIDGDGYLEWIGEEYSNYDHDNNPATPNMTECLWAQRGARQFARLARVIKNDKILNEKYGNRADYIIEMTKKNIVYHPECVNRLNTNWHTVHHIVSHPITILLEFYLIDGNSEYLSIITARAQQMKNSMFPQPTDSNALGWLTTNDTSYPFVVNDVSHSEDVVSTAIEFYRAGIVFTREDIDKLSHTFLAKIWNKDENNPKYYDTLDGQLRIYDTHPEWWLGSNIAPGWVGLGAFNSTLHKIVEAGDSSSVTNKNALNYLAYYGELARNLVAKDCQYTNNAKEICDSIDNDCDGLVDENLNCLVVQTCEAQGYACVTTGTCRGTLMNYECQQGKVCCRLVQEQTCQERGFFCLAPSNCSSSNRLSYNCDSGVCCSKHPTIIQQQDKKCFELNGKICEENEVCNIIVSTSDTKKCCIGSCIAKEIEKIECEEKEYICRDECLVNEAQINYNCTQGKICCSFKVSRFKNFIEEFWVFILIGMGFVLSLILWAWRFLST